MVNCHTALRKCFQLSVAYKRGGICNVSLVPQLKVQMRARRVARRAHQAYLVALLYLVADLYRSLREVAVERQEAVAAKSAGCDRCEYPFKTSFHF